MFDHLVRDGVILFLFGITVLTKVAPAIRQKGLSDAILKISLWWGWVPTVIGFIAMMVGVAINSW